MKIRAFTLPLAILLAATSSIATAAPLVIGTGTGGNAFPFGGTNNPNPTTFQQVYNGALFGGPKTISSISFEKTSGVVSAGTYTLSLSTTTKAVDGLDTVNFANNIGANNTQLFSGTLAGQLSGNILSFAVPNFVFDPGQGNLLLNVSVSGVPTNFVGFFRANNGDAAGAFSRAHDFGTGFSGFGLVTTFDVGAAAVVPEPATWAMMIAGFGLAGAAMRRRVRTAVTFA